MQPRSVNGMGAIARVMSKQIGCVGQVELSHNNRIAECLAALNNNKENENEVGVCLCFDHSRLRCLDRIRKRSDTRARNSGNQADS